MQAIDLTSSDAAESGATTTTADESDISNSKKKALVLPSFFTFARKDRNQWAHCNDCVKVHGQDSEAGKALLWILWERLSRWRHARQAFSQQRACMDDSRR